MSDENSILETIATERQASKQIMRFDDPIVLRNIQKPRKREVVKYLPLCETLPSLRVEKHKRAKNDRHKDPFYYKFDGISWRGMTLPELVEIHMRLGQFLEGEKQPDWLKY